MSVSAEAIEVPRVATAARQRALPWAEVVIGGTVALLILLSLLMLFSIERGLKDVAFAKKQTLWLGISFVAFLAAWRLDWIRWRPYLWHLAGATVALLIAILLFGDVINGARRWLHIGPMNLQGSDLAKIVLVFVLAHYLAQRQRRLREFGTGFIVPGLIIAVPCGLILLQPDYGTTALCAAVGGSLLFLAGVRLAYLIPAGTAAAGLFAVAIALDPVRLKRITSFLDVEAHKATSTYQLDQGILGFALGGLDGVGLGQGRQQMAFLPEAHTDFIFAIVGEELGLWCTLGTVLCFLIIFTTVLVHLRKAPDLFQFLIVMGCLLLITGQALINFGVTTGCLPTKGMSLPFVSYGGSNLLSMFLMLGIIFNCLGRWREPTRPAAREILSI